jgi:hypothetical protein
MSTHIIDRVAAVKFPKERTGYYADYYLLATLSGDNNCINTATGRRARHWNPTAMGEEWKCLARACEIAASFCGGCARFVHGRSTPEAFITRCREALATGPDYDSPQAAFGFTQTAITFTAEEKANGSKYYYERLLEKRGQPEMRDLYLRGHIAAFPFKLTEPRDMAVLIEHLPHDKDNSDLWHHVRISGPGEV